MPARSLYIAAYDIAEPRRLRRVHLSVKAHATGGQKSAYECFLTPRERDGLIAEVRGIIDESEDRFAMLRVQERARPIIRGTATPPADPDFYYIG